MLRLPPRLVRTVLATLWLLAASFHTHAFDLQAHRGARGLLPENTLAAFAHALELGVTTIELDIAITADGVPVISHDPALNPVLTRDARGRWLGGTGPLIRDLSLAQVKAYDIGRMDPATAYARDFPHQQPRDGQRIPTLAELFALVRERGANDVHFDIETKIFPNRPGDTVAPEVFVDKLLAAVTEAGLIDRVMVQSFDWRTLRLLHRRAPTLRTVYLTVESPRANNARDPAWTDGLKHHDYASTAHMIKASGGHVWAPNHQSLDAAAVKAAQQLGLKVIPWTVNEPVDMDRLIGWGVDGIISDYPDRLRTAVQRAGMPLPRGVGKN